jgi:non-specific serine/threonine protein kinase
VLVLDNCEHVLAASRSFVEAALAAVPSLRIVATSREPLGVAGETVVRLDPLPVDDTPDADAVALFLDRVGAARVSARSIRTVADVCRRLDGVPLAIELVAGWVPQLSPEEILARLDQRLELFVDRSGRLPERQRMLRSTIAWSYDRLEPAEQRLFDRLTVFPGSFPLDAAEAVADPADGGTEPVLVRLARLVAASMVEVRPTELGRRYVLLESMRAFGRERLTDTGGLDSASAAMLGWAAGFVARAEPGMNGPDQRVWLDAAALEADSVAAAVDWAVRGDPEAGLRLAGGFWRYWYSRSLLRQGERSMRAALAAAPGASPEARLKGLWAAGVLARQRGDFETAIRDLREHLELAHSLGQAHAIAEAHNSLAGALHGSGDSAAARALLADGVDWWRRAGDQHGLASALSNLGVLASDVGEFDAALAYGREALAMRLTLGHAESIAISYENVATAALRVGDHAVALPSFRESLRRYADLDEPDGIAASLEGIAAITGGADGVRWFAAAAALRRRFDVPPSPADDAYRLGRIDALRAAVGDRGFATAWAAGEAISSETAVEEARRDHDAGGGSRLTSLTDRERDVLALLAEGHTAKEMATRLGVSVRTIDRHLGSIYRKLDARGRADAIAFALRR